MVHRSIGTEELESLDPFLTFDEFRMSPDTAKNAPSNDAPAAVNENQGATDTEGSIHGNEAPSAGRSSQGKSHEKSRNKKESKEIWGLQLWVNLPKVHKFCKPQYQELKHIPQWSSSSSMEENTGDHLASRAEAPSLQMATEQSQRPSETRTRKQASSEQTRDQIEVRVIAGESHGVKSKVYTRTPTQYLEIKMKSRSSLTESIPETFEGFAYVLQGRGYFGKEGIQGLPQQMLVLSAPVSRPRRGADSRASVSVTSTPGPVADQQSEADSTLASVSPTQPPMSYLQIVTKDEPLHMVLIAGEPCREPVFRQGPFVLNSKEELQRTFRDYEEKKRGFERAKGWSSTIGQKLPPTAMTGSSGRRPRREEDEVTAEDETSRQKGRQHYGKGKKQAANSRDEQQSRATAEWTDGENVRHKNTRNQRKQ
ncbi:hypothetical protein BGZ72_004337 [Mortierella alpina]|nr:hypothetical protein BGZ72_004337 [Mortierella alpina]